MGDSGPQVPAEVSMHSLQDNQGLLNRPHQQRSGRSSQAHSTQSGAASTSHATNADGLQWGRSLMGCSGAWRYSDHAARHASLRLHTQILPTDLWLILGCLPNTFDLTTGSLSIQTQGSDSIPADSTLRTASPARGALNSENSDRDDEVSPNFSFRDHETIFEDSTIITVNPIKRKPDIISNKQKNNATITRPNSVAIGPISSLLSAIPNDRLNSLNFDNTLEEISSDDRIDELITVTAASKIGEAKQTEAEDSSSSIYEKQQAEEKIQDNAARDRKSQTQQQQPPGLRKDGMKTCDGMMKIAPSRSIRLFN